MANSFKEWLLKFNIDCDESFLVLPVNCPTPLKNDWTAMCGNRSSAEEEIRNYTTYNNDYSIQPGVLFSRIERNKLRSAELIDEADFAELTDESIGTVTEIKNLFFSWTLRRFFVFMKVYEEEKKRNKPGYTFDEEIKRRMTLLALLFKKHGLLDRVTICIRCKDVKLAAFKYVRDFAKAQNIRYIYAQGTRKFPVCRRFTSDGMAEKVVTFAESLLRECKDAFHFNLNQGVLEVLEANSHLTECPSGLQMIPENDQLIWEVPIREAKAEGVYALSSLIRIKGEIEDFYHKTIAPIKQQINGSLIYSASAKMVENFISMPKGHLFEVDWVLFLSTIMLFIEVSAGQNRKPWFQRQKGPELRKLEQVFTKYLPCFNSLAYCVNKAAKLCPDSELTDFRRKHFKCLIYVKDISIERWNTFLRKTPAIKYLKTALRKIPFDSNDQYHIEDVFIAAKSDRPSSKESEIELHMIRLNRHRHQRGDIVNAELQPVGKTLRDLFLGRMADEALMKHFQLFQLMKRVFIASALDFYKNRFGQQQHELLNDVMNPLKFIIGEAGTGKSYVCMALAKKYIEELGFHKVFYLIPKHKKACKMFVERTLREEFLIDVSWKDKLIVLANVNRNDIEKRLKDAQGFGLKLGLIIDECTISTKNELIEMGNHISDLFPYFDMVCLNVPVGGQINCTPGVFNNTRTMGFQRYVLTVGYRSSNTILLFNSRALHANTGKHVCGTSIVSVAPRAFDEHDIEVTVAATNGSIRRKIEQWRKMYAPENRSIIVFRDGSQGSRRFRLRHVAGEERFFASTSTDLRDLPFSGFEQDHVLVVFLDQMCPSYSGVSESIDNDERAWPDESFGRLLLNASTRARKSLQFLVTTNVEKDELLKLVNNDDHHLIVASSVDLDGGNQDQNLISQNFYGEHAEDIVRVGVHREDINLVYHYFEQKVNTNDLNELNATFARLVLPGLIGRKKSLEFRNDLTQFVKSYKIDNSLNQLDFAKMQNWYVSAYSRGLLSSIEWRMERGVPQGITVDNLEPLIAEILFSAVYNGSSEVIKHAFGQGCHFFENGLNIDVRRMVSKLIFEQRFAGNGAGEQSLLSLITKTNKNPEAAKYLLDYLPREHFEISHIKKSLAQSLLWSVKYCAFDMLQVLICGKDEPCFEEIMWDILKDTLQQCAESEQSHTFIKKVENYANLSQDAEWDAELLQLHNFIIKLHHKIL